MDIQTKSQERFLLGKQIFNYSDLLNNFPPKINNLQKLLLCKIANKVKDDLSKELHFSRYHIPQFPETFDNWDLKIEQEENAFDYKPNQNINILGKNFFKKNSFTKEWYMNFADPFLFTAYGGSLMAQDEMQVAEHPILGNLTEALRKNFLKDKTSPIVPFTQLDLLKPTPCIIRNIERKIKISIDANAEKLRPYGLYGNQFSRASDEAIINATEIIDPPTITNLICMAAPCGGYKRLYKENEILLALNTAYSGFLGAKLETEEYFNQLKIQPSEQKIIINTGNWGTGAFGNNKQLMPLVQMIAAKAAKIDVLKFHTFNKIHTEEFFKALEFFQSLTEKKEQLSANEIFQSIIAQKYYWGCSDGN